MQQIVVLLMGLLLAGGGIAQDAGMPPQIQGNPVEGKSKAVGCVGCHGVNGIGNNPLWPNLAGQKMEYTLKQLKAFREGTRQDPLMTPPARALSEQDMADLAAWFAGLSCAP